MLNGPSSWMQNRGNSCSKNPWSLTAEIQRVLQTSFVKRGPSLWLSLNQGRGCSMMGSELACSDWWICDFTRVYLSLFKPLRVSYWAVRWRRGGLVLEMDPNLYLGRRLWPRHSGPRIEGRTGWRQNTSTCTVQGDKREDFFYFLFLNNFCFNLPLYMGILLNVHCHDWMFGAVKFYNPRIWAEKYFSRSSEW